MKRLVIVILIIFFSGCTPGSSPENNTSNSSNVDLAIKVCYDILENEVWVRGVIENVGSQTFDQGGTYKVEATANAVTYFTNEIVIPPAPWSLAPGETHHTDIVKIPFFDPLNYTTDQEKKDLESLYYMSFYARVTGNGDKNPANDTSEIFSGGVNVFKVIDEASNYACPSAFN